MHLPTLDSSRNWNATKYCCLAAALVASLPFYVTVFHYLYIGRFQLHIINYSKMLLRYSYFKGPGKTIGTSGR